MKKYIVIILLLINHLAYAQTGNIAESCDGIGEHMTAGENDVLEGKKTRGQMKEFIKNIPKDVFKTLAVSELTNMITTDKKFIGKLDHEREELKFGIAKTEYGKRLLEKQTESFPGLLREAYLKLDNYLEEDKLIDVAINDAADWLTLEMLLIHGDECDEIFNEKRLRQRGEFEPVIVSHTPLLDEAKMLYDTGNRESKNQAVTLSKQALENLEEGALDYLCYLYQDAYNSHNKKKGKASKKKKKSVENEMKKCGCNT